MSLARNLQYLDMMLEADSKAGNFYDMLGTPALLCGKDGVPIMNMGYWRETPAGLPTDLREASQALQTLIGEYADLEDPEQTVLDVGCGFGSNALYLLRKYKLRSIIGLNTSSVQLRWGAAMAARERLGEQVRFVRGSATSMPLADCSVDRIICVEAAFHFSLRTHFFTEAYRVLKPGGLLAMVDLIPLPPKNVLQRSQFLVLRRALQIPGGNVYGLPEYTRNLTAAGLHVELMRSIREDVIPHYPRWLRAQPLSKMWNLDVLYMLGMASFFMQRWDYALITARK